MCWRRSLIIISISQSCVMLFKIKMKIYKKVSGETLVHKDILTCLTYLVYIFQNQNGR